MSGKPVVHLYCLCWNEARLIPFFLRYYGGLVDRFFVFDNGSTDGSLEMLSGDPRITVEHFESGDSFVLTEKAISDTVWKRSIGVADWVFMVDMDEFLFHPNLSGLLERSAAEGVTAIESITFNMIADRFPDPAIPLTEQVTLGVRSAEMKLGVFDPSAIAETHYAPGRHRSSPTGRVVYPSAPPLLMLHYKRLGLNYSLQRNRMLDAGLRERDRQNNWGYNYSWSFERMIRDYEELRVRREPVPGLKGGPDFERYLVDERTIREAGVLDGDWYLERYPDVRSADMDPMAHFLANGLKEGRNPNAEIDLQAYRARMGQRIPATMQPLLHYIRHRDGAIESEAALT